MPISILIIDDEPRVLRAFARNLRLGGYTVFTANSGAEGVELYHQEQPEIVITDLRMPEMTGQDVLQAIRAHDPEANVILVSGHGDQDEILEAMRAGASDFLPKPVDQVTLESALRRAAERVHLKRELRASQAALRQHNARLEEEVAKRTAELRQTTQRFQALLDHSPALVHIFDEEGRYLLVGEATAEAMGLAREEIIGKTFAELLPPETVATFMRRVERLKEDRAVLSVEDQITVNGEEHFFESLLFPLSEEDGMATYAAIGTEVTARKQAEEALEEERAFLSTVLENIEEAIIICDAEGRIIRFNEAARRLHGVPEQPIPPDQWAGYYDLYQADGVTPLPTEKIPLFRALQDEHVRDAEIVVNPVHSEPRSLVCSGQALTDAAGKITSAVVTMHDITARKRMEITLRESERRYRQLFESAPISIWEEDFSAVKDRLDALPLQDIPDLRAYFLERPALVQELAALVQVVDVNQATLKLYHADSKDTFFAGIGQVFAPESYEDFIGALLVIAEGGIVLETEKTHLTLDGQILHVQLHWAVAPGCEDTYARVLVNIVDITARKRMEAALRESESRVKHKLKSILSPAGDLSSLDLGDIIDVEAIQSLLDHFYALTHIGIAIVDMEGEVLVATGWQDICTEFHRVHPETCQYCIESDTALSAGITPGDHKLYKCKNNMWDMATPIVVGGRHVGNLFLGQFFFADEPVDREAFRKQAEVYGFDEEAYLTALDRVPRWSREKVRTVFRFYTELATLISQLSHSNLNLAQSLAEKKRLIAELKRSEQTFKSYIEHAPYGIFVADEQGCYIEVNAAACQMTGYARDELLNMQIVHLSPPEHREAAEEHFRTVVEEGGPQA